ncbi:Rcf3 protein [Saccharomycopsis crataegensis]|uniref:Rcf3 protein n=1 Tax=Saccharomycopsis crataegensis TaxID=43959 RepID=A0AAV5QS03_9ASCO|nr:Rcf3 protein [Saccharomycopsis crataegensis]
MTQAKPLHYEEGNIKRLNKEISTALFIGGVKGLVFGLGSFFAVSMAYPSFRRSRLPVKAFWFVCWIGAGAVFDADKQVVVYSTKYKIEKERRDQMILEQAADNGEYIDSL